MMMMMIKLFCCRCFKLLNEQKVSSKHMLLILCQENCEKKEWWNSSMIWQIHSALTHVFRYLECCDATRGQMQTTKVFLVLSPLVLNGIVCDHNLASLASPSLGWHCRCQGRSHCQGRERGRRGLGDETKKAIMTWHHSHLSVDIGTRNREPSFLVHATHSLVNFYQQAQTHSIVKVVFIIHWDSDTFSLNSIWGTASTCSSHSSSFLSLYLASTGEVGVSLCIVYQSSKYSCQW